jgi:hypothetical protein
LKSGNLQTLKSTFSDRQEININGKKSGAWIQGVARENRRRIKTTGTMLVVREHETLGRLKGGRLALARSDRSWGIGTLATK